MINTLDRHRIGSFLRAQGAEAWGIADNESRLPRSPDLPRAVSLLKRIDPEVLHGMRQGPTQDYCDEYVRLNAALDAATGALAGMLQEHGCRAVAVPATVEDASLDGDGPFSHKAAATTAGLGWIGKTALFVSLDFGPAVRLATVFTDLELPAGEPIVEGRCGTCRACVDACPAGCGRDVAWRAGMGREELFDAAACSRHMDRYTGITERICGICIAACPLTHKG